MIFLILYISFLLLILFLILFSFTILFQKILCLNSTSNFLNKNMQSHIIEDMYLHKSKYHAMRSDIQSPKGSSLINKIKKLN